MNPNPNPNVAPKQFGSLVYSQDFILNLTMAITGKSIEKILLENNELESQNLIKNCTKIMVDSVIHFVEEKYGKASGLRLKACLVTDDENIFSKYPELENYLNEGMNIFLEELESTI